MTINRKHVLAACAAILLAGCSTPAVDTADAKPDPRQGEQVRNICFTQQIRGWRSLNNRAIIVQARVNDEYKLDLVGACNPDDAFNSVGLVSRVGGGSCLEQGDHLVTDSRFAPGACAISRIYKWNKDAAQAPAAAAS